MLSIASLPSANIPRRLSVVDSGSIVADTVLMKAILRSVRQLVVSYPDSAIGILEAEWARTSGTVRQVLGLDYFLARAEAQYEGARMSSCLLECDSALRYCRLGHEEDNARIEFWKGRLLSTVGDYGTAFRMLDGALAAFSRVGDLRRMAECNAALGHVHYAQEQYALAERRWRTMLTLARQAQDPRLEAKALRAVGVACLYLYDPDDIGHAYYDSALVVSRRLGDPRELAGIHSNIGQYMDSALYYAEASRDEAWLHDIMHTAGVIGMRRGDLAAGLRYCNQSLEFAERSGNRMLERDAAQCLCEYYRLTGKWKEAFQAQERWRGINDQMLSSRTRDEVAMRAMGREFDSRAREDSILHVAEMEKLESARTLERLRADRNRNSAMALGSGGLLLFAGGIVLFRIDRRRRRERFERDVARMETQVLRTQMNPHFIFNALNSINNYVQENERDLASGFLSKFARLMRLVLENSRHDEVPLAQDLEALRLYMDLEQARMNNRFRYEVDIDLAIDQDNTMVPPLVLQPFVENAIWHGLSRKDGAGLLRLSVRQVGGMLVMTVEDDGVGRDAAAGPTDPTAPFKTSMGTGITQERLEMLGKQRGGEAGFHYVEVTQGTCVEVRFPMAREASA